ncbi:MULTISPECIES: peptidoglycan recognition protein family protein [Streptomyces]|uniref:Peptidoglycan recognition family protein n=1 Tax=Streptomyces edwardsiae TaxID=3075527 RepID=A0ABU2QM88_9ACTN|nr:MULTISPECIES: peptidoglycan recognition family protein [unclassified Streptomyces]MDT0405582.1 peptidoglycan recognition family protein [Streptomyces sp. DSM 41635]
MHPENPLRRRLLFAGAAGLAAVTAMPGSAHARGAEAIEPDIDSTGAWGARSPQGNIGVLQYRPSRIVIHHTVSANTADFSRAQAHAHAHWVQDLHLDENGWVDTGYHFLVSRGGWITEGRHGSLQALTGGRSFVLGAHTSGQNEQAIGIACEGAYHAGAVPPGAQWDVLVALCAYACVRYGVSSSQIFGHKDYGSTLCPGVYHELLPRLREEVGAAV